MKELLQALGIFGANQILRFDEFLERNLNLRTFAVAYVGSYFSALLYLAFISAGWMWMSWVMLSIVASILIPLAALSSAAVWAFGAMPDVFKTTKEEAKNHARSIFRFALAVLWAFGFILACGMLFFPFRDPEAFFMALFLYAIGFGMGYLRGYTSEVPYKVMMNIALYGAILLSVRLINPYLFEVLRANMEPARIASATSIARILVGTNMIWMHPVAGPFFTFFVILLLGSGLGGVWLANRDNVFRTGAAKLLRFAVPAACLVAIVGMGIVVLLVAASPAGAAKGAISLHGFDMNTLGVAGFVAVSIAAAIGIGHKLEWAPASWFLVVGAGLLSLALGSCFF